jgi:hypothetical protein
MQEGEGALGSLGWDTINDKHGFAGTVLPQNTLSCWSQAVPLPLNPCRTQLCQR